MIRTATSSRLFSGGDCIRRYHTQHSRHTPALAIASKQRFHRYFSGLNGEGHSKGVDVKQFTKEVKVIMPDVTQDYEDYGVLKGTIQTWYKKPGDLIKKDDVLCDIETKLFTFGLSTDDEYDSIMGDIIVPVGAEPVEPGTVICTTFNAGNDDDKDS